MSALVVTAVDGGPCLLEDEGRAGFAAIGVGVSGAADRASYSLGNRMVGNAVGAASIEVVLGGLEVEASGHVTVCVTGAPTPLTVDGRPEPSGAVLMLRPGQRLRLGLPATGLRSYVAVRGGCDLPPILGSRSHDVLADLGPRALSPGMRIPVGAAVGGDILVDAVPPASYDDEVVVRVVRGPHDDWVSDPDQLVSQTWRVGAASNRVGLRLEGEAFTPVPGRGELPSLGALRGAIQLPPAGLPVIFGPDHPVTGGYPVLGVIVDSDTDRLAQLRPGDSLRLRWS